MNLLDNFELWLRESNKLSATTIEHYKRAVKAVSNDMLALGVINKSLSEMSLLEFDIAVNKIITNSEFVAKNNKGHRMYSTGLAQYRYFLLLNCDTVDNVNEDELIGNVSATEKEVIVKSRVGQGVYRSKLIKKYNGQCIVTGLRHPKLMVASHIKPWAVCSNYERIDESNGLLLSANIDRLFDSGLLTFKANGEIVISKYVGEYNARLLGLENGRKVNLLETADLLKYLEYHRDVLFAK